MHRARYTDLQARLHTAVEEGNTKEVEDVLELCRGSFYPETLNIGGALCKAVEACNLEIIPLLLKARRDAHRHVTPEGKRAIHYAALSGNIDVVKLILTSGSSLMNISDSSGKTAMHYAVEEGYVSIIQHLLQQGATVTRTRSYVEGETPLHIAAKTGHFDICRMLVERGGNLNFKTRKEATAIHLAIKGKHFRVVTLFCEAGANLEEVNEKGQTALLLAVENMSSIITHTLLKFGANPNARDMRGRSSMHYLAMSMCHDSNIEMAKHLIAAGMENTNIEDVDRYTPLHYAAFKGNILLVNLLLEMGVDVNKYYVWRMDTPLIMAISNKQIEMVSLLVEAGADVTVEDGPLTKVTALHKVMVTRYPRIEDKLAISDILISHGAKLNIKTARERTPLEDCVFYSAVIRDSSLPILMKLVSSGAKLQLPNMPRADPKNSPLCWLTWHGNLPAAKFLVSIGWNLQNETWIWLPGKDDEASKFLSWLQELVRRPLSLRLICRRVIRDYLVDYCSNDTDITSFVSRLPLPMIVKKFLMLKPEIEEFTSVHKLTTNILAANYVRRICRARWDKHVEVAARY